MGNMGEKLMDNKKVSDQVSRQVRDQIKETVNG